MNTKFEELIRIERELMRKHFDIDINNPEDIPNPVIFEQNYPSFQKEFKENLDRYGWTLEEYIKEIIKLKNENQKNYIQEITNTLKRIGEQFLSSIPNKTKEDELFNSEIDNSPDILRKKFNFADKTDRTKKICADDISDLKILLETSNNIDEFLKKI